MNRSEQPSDSERDSPTQETPIPVDCFGEITANCFGFDLSETFEPRTPLPGSPSNSEDQLETPEAVEPRSPQRESRIAPRIQEPSLTSRPSAPTDAGLSEQRARHILRVSFQKEKRRKNPPKKKSYHCSVCDIRVPSAYQLKRHKDAGPHKRKLAALAAKELNLECRLCDKKFHSENNYKEHIRGDRHRKKRRRLENN